MPENVATIDATPQPERSKSDLSDQMSATVERLRARFGTGVTRSLEWREEQLDGVITFLEDHTSALTAAMHQDLGRPALEAWIADIGPSIAEAKYVRKNLRKWAKPRKVSLSIATQPGKARIVPEPLGVALIIAPWNYPVNLVFEPLVAALGAGNAVVLKPSELSPATSTLIARELPSYLDREAVAVIEGAVDVSTALLEQRFDHIFFTGSTNVGRIVMRAAAEHLTPVLLELGGKSPVIVDDDANIAAAANRIAWGKGLNAGQTCIAPDYVLVSERRRDELVDALVAAWSNFYGRDIESSADFGRIVSDRHHRRLTGLLDGHEVAFGGGSTSETRYLSPTIVVDPSPASDLMTEEIFGPILPIVTVADTDHAIQFVNERPKPLALYVFSENGDAVDRVTSQTSSGGVCVNHTLFHFSPHDLAFGGVGPSGMGRYHGQAGFDALSNLKGILTKPAGLETSIIYPPYGKLKSRLLRLVT